MPAPNDSSRTIPRLALNQAEAAAALGIGEEAFVQHVRPHVKRVDMGRRMLFPVTEL
jgi:hypothetical protein